MCPQNVSMPQSGNRAIPVIDIRSLRDGTDPAAEPITCGNYLEWRFGNSFASRGNHDAAVVARA